MFRLDNECDYSMGYSVPKAYSETLSRRNFGRVKATYGDFRPLKQNSPKHHGDLRRF